MVEHYNPNYGVVIEDSDGSFPRGNSFKVYGRNKKECVEYARLYPGDTIYLVDRFGKYTHIRGKR